MSELVIAEKSDLVAIADTIREKIGSEDSFAFPTDFVEAISTLGLSIAFGSFTPSSDVYSYEVTHNLGKPPIIAAFIVESSFSSLITGAKLAGIAYYDKEYITPRTQHYTVQYRISGSSQFFNSSTNTDGTLAEYTNPTSTAMPCYMIVAYAATDSTITFGNANQSQTKFVSGKTYEWMVIA